MTESFTEALAAAHQLYKDGKNSEAAAKYSEAIKQAGDKYKYSTILSRARAYFRAGRYSRALSDCAEVLGSHDASLAGSASQLKGECFLREEELEAALEAFQEATEKTHSASGKEAADAFVAATEKALKDGSSIDFAELQKFSGAASAKDRGFVPKPVSKTHRMELTPDCTDAMDACESKPSTSGPAKPFDATAQAERVKAAMARPGPSVHVEDLDLAQNPFASHVPLTAPSKYRMQHNQSPNGVEVQVFAKKLNAKPERVLVEIGQRHLKVQIKDEDCNEVEYTFDEDLYHEVDVESSCFKILGTQVLVKLKKADNSITWPSLTNTDVPVAHAGTSIVNTAAGPPTEYPSSSNKKHQDWNKLESDQKKEEKEEKLEGEAGLNKFFRELYGGLDEDARRAMNKSFVGGRDGGGEGGDGACCCMDEESGGTALSTNWKEVGAKTLQCEPPEGVKVKKFEY